MRLISLVVVILLSIPSLYSQQEIIEIDGGIRISNSEDATPTPGTIRFNPATNDFEGWNGQWRSLTGSHITHGSGTVTDIDGNRYQTVNIGTQTWMRENLRTSRFNNGDTIRESVFDWPHLSSDTPAYCSIQYNSENDHVLGKSYNWHAVNDSNGLCPMGWHVPTQTEWTTLFDYLGSINTGGKMKETGLLHWASPNVDATNESGFSALATAYLCRLEVNIGTGWWANTETSSDRAYSYRIIHYHGDIITASTAKHEVWSIRCLKD